MFTFSTDSPDIIRRALGDRCDHFMLFDSMGEIADHYATIPHRRRTAAPFCGGITDEQARQFTINGDLARAASSDKLLENMERFELPTSRRAWSDDVCGSLPNVPAFIAGHPLNMRRRIRSDDAAAPLAIIVDVTTSASVTPSQIATRGAAILALTRALASRRPIELWACAMAGADKGRSCITVAVRIDTTPLDLARAAYAATHAGFARHVLYDECRQFGYEGDWPYSGGALSRAQMEAICAPAFTHVTETLCLPGIHASDESLTNPQAWLARQIAEHGAVNLDAA